MRRREREQRQEKQRRVRDAVVETDGAPDDEDMQEALQELNERMSRMRERQDRETTRLKGLVARNLGQPSAEIGAVPFIDSAAAAASSSYVRSRSPAKKDPKKEFSITVPILDPETNQPIEPKIKKEDEKTIAEAPRWAQMKTIEKFMETEHAKGEIDDDTYDYFKELLDQYNDAMQNSSRRQAEKLKE